MYSILKEKASNIKVMHLLMHTILYSEVGNLLFPNALYEWYLVAVLKNIYPNGPTLIEKAKLIVEHLNITDFQSWG